MKTKSTILIIEDEPDIIELLEYNLTREGFETLSARDGETGLKQAQQSSPALVLLDLMLPNMDGLEVCRRIKASPETANIPIIMVTAKGEESDVVLGLGLGADDYVIKPFSPKEVVARVKSVLRRSKVLSNQNEPVDRLSVGDITIDASRYEVFVKEDPVSLTRAEFRLLRALMTSLGRVLTREQLLDKINDEGTVVIDRNVDVHIGALRRKLGSGGSQISTIRGVGYKFLDS